MVRGWWSAIITSCCCGQRFGGELFSSRCCGQGLVVSHSHHVAVVRGWWSAILIMLLWSGVGGQLFSSCRCGQGLVVSYCHIMLLWPGVGGQLLPHHVARVKGWWWTVLIMSLWSEVGGQLFSSCCCGQGLMVSYSHHVAVVRGPLHTHFDARIRSKHAISEWSNMGFLGMGCLWNTLLWLPDFLGLAREVLRRRKTFVTQSAVSFQAT